MVGYVGYSVFERLRTGGAPTQQNVLVLAVATQAPDLIDKPLAWQFGVLSSGVGAAHSLLVGVPVAALIGVWLRGRGQTGTGIAVVIGQVSHVLGDLLFSWLFGSSPVLASFVWPLGPAPGPTSAGLLVGVWDRLLGSQALLATPKGQLYVLLEVVLLVVTVGLWFYDGMPGLARWLRTPER
jgi:membrane-bound metal-dependent hydrolase YbcI (DUF457 family)